MSPKDVALPTTMAAHGAHSPLPRPTNWISTHSGELLISDLDLQIAAAQMHYGTLDFRARTFHFPPYQLILCWPHHRGRFVTLFISTHFRIFYYNSFFFLFAPSIHYCIASNVINGTEIMQITKYTANETNSKPKLLTPSLCVRTFFVFSFRLIVKNMEKPALGTKMTRQLGQAGSTQQMKPLGRESRSPVVTFAQRSRYQKLIKFRSYFISVLFIEHITLYTFTNTNVI